MKSALVSKENSLATFTLEFTGEEFDKATQAAYLKLRGQFSIDGFRKGKAPRSIIEKRYGEGIFFEDAIDDLLNDGYGKALDELGIEPIDRPQVEFGEEKFEKGKGFTATIKVAIPPEVKVKGYKGVEAERVVRKVTAKDVDAELKNMQERNSRLVSVERAAENGDTVIIDYKGFVGETQFEGGTAEMQQLELGSGTFIPGFEDQLVGTKAGDEKDVKVTFPKEYHANDLAGKEAIFQCKVHEVKVKEVPLLDDEFAKDASEFDTLKELKADIKKRLQKQNDDAAKYDVQNKLMDKIVAANKFEVPEVMINDETDQMLNEMSQQMMYQGLDLETYCKYMGTTVDDMRKDMKQDAEARVKSRLIVKAVAEKEKIEATEDEIEAEFARMAEMYGMKVEEVKKALGGSLAMVKEDLVSRKAIDFIYDNAKITDVDAAAKADAEKKEAKAPAKKATTAKKETKAPAKKDAKAPAKKTTKKEEK